VKQQTIYKCQECGYSSSKWLGKCPQCEAWNTFVEELETRISGTKKNLSSSNSGINLNNISTQKIERLSTGINEFDRILGKGMVPGSLILIGGAPGIGKSTLLLQMSNLCKRNVLYVSGEESASQIKLRADRLNIKSEKIVLLSTDNLYDIEKNIKETKPEVVIVDSIQTVSHPELDSIAGSVGQVREVTNALIQIAKKENIVIFLVGHITKEGALAGPKILEHVVDVVMYFEDENGIYRIIRCFKNRFGATSEIAVFEMTGKGLEDVDNPERLFYGQNENNISGTVLTSLIEGTRPITIEVQALVTKSGYGIARRQASGIDFNRLLFIIAVIEKRLGINLANQDIFVNIVGGIKVKEPAIDLAIASAILSSFFDVVVPHKVLFLGEIGLGGELRPVMFEDERISRAEKLGITECVVSQNKKNSNKNVNIKKIRMKYINELNNYIKEKSLVEN
jgi:DNA repair protein RadA/Sms